jgi:hypothetical protein
MKDVCLCIGYYSILRRQYDSIYIRQQDCYGADEAVASMWRGGGTLLTQKNFNTLSYSVNTTSVFRAHCHNGRHKRTKFGIIIFRVPPQRFESALALRTLHKVTNSAVM